MNAGDKNKIWTDCNQYQALKKYHLYKTPTPEM